MATKKDNAIPTYATWTKARLLVLLSNAKFDLFTNPKTECTAKDLRLWLDKYLIRETFRKRKSGKN